MSGEERSFCAREAMSLAVTSSTTFKKNSTVFLFRKQNRLIIEVEEHYIKNKDRLAILELLPLHMSISVYLYLLKQPYAGYKKIISTISLIRYMLLV